MNINNKFDAVSFGYSAMDYLGIVPHFPAENLKLEMERFEIQGGGPAATAAVTMRRLGLKTAYSGIVADDGFGRTMLELLNKEDIDTSSVIIEQNARSQFAFIMVDRSTGKRTILWTRGTLPFIRPDQVDRDLILSANGLLVDTLEPEAAAHAAGIASENNIPVVIDAGTLRDKVEEILPFCDYIVASETFASQISNNGTVEEALEQINSYNPRGAVVTLGENGCAGLEGNNIFREQGFKIKAVDTTGAGDVFHGAFLYGVLQGWDLRKISVFSNAVAGLKCRKLGGRAGIPDIDQALEFLRANRPDIDFEITFPGNI
ncbi:MAG: PfkB family carbohydrate kinase [Candidatus Krumholzibacteriales bacterium]